MAEEIEVKFLDVPHEGVRTKLIELGGVMTSQRTLHKRKVYDFADASLGVKGGWVRLRDEGDKVTLTYKQNNVDAVGDVIKTLEDEVIVSNYDETHRLLVSIGLNEESSQENYREVWQLVVDDSIVEIMLDEWPFVKPYIELELVDGEAAALQILATALGLQYEDSIQGSVIPVYMNEYNVSEEQFKEHRGLMAFDQPKPNFLKK